jgi:hypothetical protein
MLKAWFSPNGRFSVGEWNADKFSPTPHIRMRIFSQKKLGKKMVLGLLLTDFLHGLTRNARD